MRFRRTQSVCTHEEVCHVITGLNSCLNWFPLQRISEFLTCQELLEARLTCKLWNVQLRSAVAKAMLIPVREGCSMLVYMLFGDKQRDVSQYRDT